MGMAGKRHRGGKEVKAAPKKMMKAASDDYTRTGSVMGVLGGLLLLVTIIIPWVELDEPWDIFALIEYDVTYWLLLTGLILGGVVMVLSFLLYKSGLWVRSKQMMWGMVALALSSYSLAVMVLSLLQIQSDLGEADLFRYGPAPFLGFFGAMLCLAGSALFVLDRQGALGPAPSRSWPDAGQRSRGRAPEQRASRQVHCPNCGAVGYQGGTCTACGMDLEEDEDQEE